MEVFEVVEDPVAEEEARRLAEEHADVEFMQTCGKVAQWGMLLCTGLVLLCMTRMFWHVARYKFLSWQHTRHWKREDLRKKLF